MQHISGYNNCVQIEQIETLLNLIFRPILIFSGSIVYTLFLDNTPHPLLLKVAFIISHVKYKTEINDIFKTYILEVFTS